MLVVDDEEDLRDVIAFDFSRQGYEVLTAASGNEALRIVESRKVDIILTDVRMPDGDGVALLDGVKANHPTLPVVMFITESRDLSLEMAYAKGVEAVFAKPFDRQALVDAVVRALQPVEFRFRRNSARVESDIPVGLKFLNSDFSVNTKARNIARGGMFVELSGRFPALEACEFHMELQAPFEGKISGTGKVRWVRRDHSAEFPAGVGVEFESFDEDCLLRMVELINTIKTRAFIPRN
jgi:CheY-like chemotaxis protein/Tfp pilus assembly protein PilZ